MKKLTPELTLDRLRDLYDARRAAIRDRLREFAQVPSSEYFYELVYCLLTPQSSAVHAARAVDRLKAMNFSSADVDPEPVLHHKAFYIRFHRTKSVHLNSTKARFPEIAVRLAENSSGKELREWLVENIKGLGWKEASHFLRNIGYRDLAILDRHILRNLQRLRVIEDLPKSLTARRYKIIEEKFRTFAASIGIPMDELDLLLWSMETGVILK